jgi:hypothetical protein
MATAIEERDVEESFVRAAGPGGQYQELRTTTLSVK